MAQGRNGSKDIIVLQSCIFYFSFGFAELTSFKQYCLLNATAASLKTVAISQNNLRPFETQEGIKPRKITDLGPL